MKILPTIIKVFFIYCGVINLIENSSTIIYKYPNQNDRLIPYTICIVEGMIKLPINIIDTLKSKYF
jgi:hypothetical protein